MPKNSKLPPRDPRFEETSGEYNEHLFRQSYSFLSDYVTREIDTIKKAIKKEKDSKTQEKLQKGLSILVIIYFSPLLLAK